MLINFSLLLTTIATLIFIIAFVIYNKDILRESTRPNIITWSLFVLITLINATSYVSMTGDLVKSVLAFTDLFVCTIITSLILFKGYYPKLSIVEKLVILFSVSSVLIWIILRSATYANLLLQFGYILAFVPTYLGVYKNSSAEKALPWFLWTLSFVINMVVITIRWSGAWQDFVNPSIAVLLHLGLALLALRNNNTDLGVDNV